MLFKNWLMAVPVGVIESIPMNFKLFNFFRGTFSFFLKIPVLGRLDQDKLFMGEYFYLKPSVCLGKATMPKSTSLSLTI